MRISQDVALKEVPSLRIIRVILFNSFYCKMAVETDDLRIDDIAPINDRAVPTGGYDITGLITETRITESVHSYANFGKIDIVDARNLFEEALINGQERLYIEFEKYTYIDGEEIVDKFAKNYYVTKLFNYQKVNKKQIYSLEFVSPFAYKNLDRRISRSYCKDFPENVIYDIFVNDLEIPEKWVYKHPETSSYQLSFIIPNYRPFNAIQWVQKSIVSLLPSSGEAPIACPWVVYETFYSGIRIEPYANFKTGYSEEDTTGRSDKIITETFVDNLFFNYGFGSRDDFKQRKKRIIDLKSSFAFNKYDNTQNAAYGSNRYLLDVAQKTFYTDEDRDGQHCEYDYRNWPNAVTIEEYAPIAPHEFCNENAPKLQNSNYTYYVPYNSKLNGDEENTRPYNYQFGDEKNNSKRN